jgi:tetratricopeptide (TPR) repeat protein
MGHYMVFNGFDDSRRILIGQDSLSGPDAEFAYDDLDRDWRGFNYIYMIIYPEEKEQQVFDLLGDQLDETANYEYAALKAANEVMGLSGSDQFFAYFNRGTNLVALQDYVTAAQMFDEAFAIYPNIPEEDRPYRALWYQTGPYYAYYHTRRYWDVISLATTTLDAMSEPMLEESYYWRARANLALGDTVGAEKDLRQALKYHEDFAPAVQMLTEMGLSD